MRKTERLGLRVTPDQKKAWEKAAAKNNMSVSKWVSTWADLGTNFPHLPK